MQARTRRYAASARLLKTGTRPWYANILSSLSDRLWMWIAPIFCCGSISAMSLCQKGPNLDVLFCTHNKRTHTEIPNKNSTKWSINAAQQRSCPTCQTKKGSCGKTHSSLQTASTQCEKLDSCYIHGSKAPGWEAQATEVIKLMLYNT